MPKKTISFDPNLLNSRIDKGLCPICGVENPLPFQLAQYQSKQVKVCSNHIVQ